MRVRLSLSSKGKNYCVVRWVKKMLALGSLAGPVSKSGVAFGSGLET
jgi:hypothetical protein